MRQVVLSVKLASSSPSTAAKTFFYKTNPFLQNAKAINHNSREV
jgi:hypothetical protein